MLHLQKHDGNEQKCDYNGCNFSTATKKQLKEHQKKHSDDYPYECKICNKGFQYRSGLKRHHDKDHKNSPIKGWGGLSKMSNKMSKMSTIELSRLGQDLFDFSGLTWAHPLTHPSTHR